MLPSGRYPTFDSRVGWASTYMKKAGLIEGLRRGYLKVTPRGLSVLKERPKTIDAKYLDRYPEFVAFRQKRAVRRPGHAHRRARRNATSRPP